MRTFYKIVLPVSFIFAFNGCFDDGLKCDTKNARDAVSEHIYAKVTHMNLSDDYLNAELKKIRYELMIEYIIDTIEAYNKNINEKNAQIEAENRYLEEKKPLKNIIDDNIKNAILEDFAQYKKVIEDFQPINKNDSFRQYFDFNVIRKSPFFVTKLKESTNESFQIHYYIFEDEIVSKEVKPVLRKKMAEEAVKTLKFKNFEEYSPEIIEPNSKIEHELECAVNVEYTLNNEVIDKNLNYISYKYKNDSKLMYEFFDKIQK